MTNLPPFELFIAFTLMHFLQFYSVKRDGMAQQGSSATFHIIRNINIFLSLIFHYGFYVFVIIKISFLTTVIFYIFCSVISILLTGIEGAIYPDKKLEKIIALDIIHLIGCPLIIIFSFNSVITYLF
jgi:hypothetical protein